MKRKRWKKCLAIGLCWMLILGQFTGTVRAEEAEAEQGVEITESEERREELEEPGGASEDAAEEAMIVTSPEEPATETAESQEEVLPGMTDEESSSDASVEPADGLSESAQTEPDVGIPIDFNNAWGAGITVGDETLFENVTGGLYILPGDRQESHQFTILSDSQAVVKNRGAEVTVQTYYGWLTTRVMVTGIDGTKVQYEVVRNKPITINLADAGQVEITVEYTRGSGDIHLYTVKNDGDVAPPSPGSIRLMAAAPTTGSTTVHRLFTDINSHLGASQDNANGNLLFCGRIEAEAPYEGQTYYYQSIERYNEANGFHLDAIALEFILYNYWANTHTGYAATYTMPDDGRGAYGYASLTSATIWRLMGQSLEGSGYAQYVIDNAGSFLAAAKAYAAAHPEGKDPEQRVRSSIGILTARPDGSYVYGDTQPLIFMGVPEDISGSITLLKEGVNKEFTESNEGYSLAGAEYIVYKDAELVSAVGVLVTRADGTANTLTGLPIGTYYVKETTASPGYSLDPNTYTVSITAANYGTTQVVNSTEEPNTDPIGVILRKLDKGTGTDVQLVAS